MLSARFENLGPTIPPTRDPFAVPIFPCDAPIEQGKHCGVNHGVSSNKKLRTPDMFSGGDGKFGAKRNTFEYVYRTDCFPQPMIMMVIETLCQTRSPTLALGEHRSHWYGAAIRSASCHSRASSAQDARDVQV